MLQPNEFEILSPQWLAKHAVLAALQLITILHNLPTCAGVELSSSDSTIAATASFARFLLGCGADIRLSSKGSCASGRLMVAV